MNWLWCCCFAGDDQVVGAEVAQQRQTSAVLEHFEEEQGTLGVAGREWSGFAVHRCPLSLLVKLMPLSSFKVHAASEQGLHRPKSRFLFAYNEVNSAAGNRPAVSAKGLPRSFRASESFRLITWATMYCKAGVACTNPEVYGDIKRGRRLAPSKGIVCPRCQGKCCNEACLEKHKCKQRARPSNSVAGGMRAVHQRAWQGLDPNMVFDPNLLDPSMAMALARAGQGGLLLPQGTHNNSTSCTVPVARERLVYTRCIHAS